MRKTLLFLAAGAALLGTALPAAAAAIHQIGSVNVSAGKYTDVTWSRFAGPLSRFSFMPENDNVDCDHVTVNYRDGTSHDIFSGAIQAGQRTTITIEGDRRIRNVDFACKAQSVDGARIALSAATAADAANFPDGDGNWEEEGRPAHLTTHPDRDDE